MIDNDKTKEGSSFLSRQMATITVITGYEQTEAGKATGGMAFRSSGTSYPSNYLGAIHPSTATRHAEQHTHRRQRTIHNITSPLPLELLYLSQYCIQHSRRKPIWLVRGTDVHKNDSVGNVEGGFLWVTKVPKMDRM